MPGSMVSYLYRRALPALSAVLLLAAPPGSRANGTKTWNHPVCGANYVPIDLGKGNCFNVINAPAHNGGAITGMEPGRIRPGSPDP